MEDIGKVFPPRDEWDIASYDTEDVVSGYREHSVNDTMPGDNRAPGYCWGWLNARKDATGHDDGYEFIRSAYIRMERLKTDVH